MYIFSGITQNKGFSFFQGVAVLSLFVCFSGGGRDAFGDRGNGYTSTHPHHHHPYKQQSGIPTLSSCE